MHCTTAASLEMSDEPRFFLELCAVFEENLSCHLAEETKFFVVGIQTA